MQAHSVLVLHQWAALWGQTEVPGKFQVLTFTLSRCILLGGGGIMGLQPESFWEMYWKVL